MDADKFNFDLLIRSIKELRNRELAVQLRDALSASNLGMDQAMVSEFIHELENDLEEHIARLERIRDEMTPAEREQPESMDPLRRQAVAFNAQCDVEEIDGLCEAFGRAREMLGNVGTDGKVKLDIKLLFTNLGGIVGLDIGGDAAGDGSAPLDNVTGQSMPPFLHKLLQGGLKARTPRHDRGSSEDALDGPDFEAMFDTSRTSEPKNRLPRDFRK